MDFAKILPIAFVLYMLLVNLIGAAVTAYDKHISRAPRGSIRRVPEKTFVRFSAFGGGIGVLMCMLLIRHKTGDHNLLLAKIAFFTVLWIALLLFLLSRPITA